MSIKSTVNGKKKKRPSNSQAAQCVNLFIMGLQENAASMPKIFIEGERFQTEFSYDRNQTQVHFKMSIEGTPTAIKYRLNFLEDESLINLQQLLPSYAFLTELRFEFCSVTYDQILFIQMIIRDNPKIVNLSLNGNPIKYQDEPVSGYCLPIHGTQLKAFSLQLCKLDSFEIGRISQLFNRPKYTRKLVYLNLGCNRLGDAGCSLIGNVLRSNRTLQALNISENGISENGLIEFLAIFTAFPLTYEEICSKRRIRFMSLTKKYFPNANISQSTNTSEHSSASLDTTSSEESLNDHPFIQDTFVENGVLLCKGNNSLQHLNIAYNEITSNLLQVLYETIEYQKHNSKTKGLQGVIFESNKPFPDLKRGILRLLTPRLGHRSRRPSSVL